ncbi:MAG: phage holin family protein [Dechloromonas sp.]|nr:phage holin family protein [Dechloromonas sp.]
MHKDPLSYELITYVWVIVLSLWGGVSGYVRKMKLGLISRFSFVELIGEIVLSGFVGVVTFWLCEWSGINPLLSAALIGISSHMGSRAIFMMETIADHYYKRLIRKIEEDR